MLNNKFYNTNILFKLIRRPGDSLKEKENNINSQEKISKAFPKALNNQNIYKALIGPLFKLSK